MCGSEPPPRTPGAGGAVGECPGGTGWPAEMSLLGTGGCWQALQAGRRRAGSRPGKLMAWAVLSQRLLPESRCAQCLLKLDQGFGVQSPALEISLGDTSCPTRTLAYPSSADPASEYQADPCRAHPTLPSPSFQEQGWGLGVWVLTLGLLLRPQGTPRHIHSLA